MALMGEAYVSELSTQGAESRDANTYRALDAGLWTPSGRSGARPGRRVGAGLELEQTSSPEGWRVQPGHVVIVASTGQVYRCHFPNAKADTVARPGAGTSRIDRFIARVYDADQGAGTTREARIERIAGTASGSPEVPSVPAGAIYQDLGTMVVPASGSITVTQTMKRTVAAGGVLPVTATERDALAAAGEAYPGMVVFNLTSGFLESYNGTAWAVAGGGPTPDTGWVDYVTLTTANTGGKFSSGRVYYRKIGKVFWMHINAIAATTITGTVQIVRLPMMGRPNFGVNQLGALNHIRSGAAFGSRPVGWNTVPDAGTPGGGTGGWVGVLAAASPQNLAANDTLEGFVSFPVADDSTVL